MAGLDWRTYQLSRDEDGWEILIERRAFEAREEISAHAEDYLSMMHLRMERARNIALSLPRRFYAYRRYMNAL